MRSCTNAYMLVYIRKSHMGGCLVVVLFSNSHVNTEDILQEVVDDDISDYLVKRFEEEK